MYYEQQDGSLVPSPKTIARQELMGKKVQENQLPSWVKAAQVAERSELICSLQRIKYSLRSQDLKRKVESLIDSIQD